MHAVAALVWREYRELRWVVLGAAVIVAAWPLVFVCRGQLEDALIAIRITVMMYAIWGGALFGMRAAAGERDGRTAAFVHALPVRPAVLGAVRLLATVVAVLLPLLGIALLSLSLNDRIGIGMRDFYRAADWRWLALAAATSVHLTLAIAAFGSGAATEPRAVARGIGGLAACWLGRLAAGGLGWLAFCGLLTASDSFPVLEQLPVSFFRTLANFLKALESFVAPAMWLYGRTDRLSGSDWSPLATLLALLALAAVFVGRYGVALGAAPSRTWKAARSTGAWSRVAALASKAARSGPLRLGPSLLGLVVLICFLVGLTAIVNPFRPEREFVSSVWFVAGPIGALACLLVPIAIFIPDLDRRINTFWRSRPIDPASWFWTTYATALVSVLVLLAVPTTLLLLWAVSRSSPVSNSLFVAGAMYWLIFSASVLATCLVRRPLTAGLLAVALVLAVTLWVASLSGTTWQPFATLLTGDFSARDRSRTMIVMAAAVVGTIAAWWAAARDIAIVK